MLNIICGIFFMFFDQFLRSWIKISYFLLRIESIFLLLFTITLRFSPWKSANVEREKKNIKCFCFWLPCTKGKLSAKTYDFLSTSRTERRGKSVFFLLRFTLLRFFQLLWKFLLTFLTLKQSLGGKLPLRIVLFLLLSLSVLVYLRIKVGKSFGGN